MKNIIETKRLFLRDPRFSDWPEVQNYASDPKVVRYMVWGPNSPAQTKVFLRQCVEKQRQRPRRRYDWAMIERATGRFIGICGMGITSPGNREGGELGYCLDREVWGKGYATEATKAMIGFAFHQLDLRRVTATCDAQNKASARVLVKSGMRKEGHFRKNMFQKGKWRDTFFFGVLKGNQKGKHGSRSQNR